MAVGHADEVVASGEFAHAHGGAAGARTRTKRWAAVSLIGSLLVKRAAVSRSTGFSEKFRLELLHDRIVIHVLELAKAV